MLAYEFAEKRPCAVGTDDRFHILRDKDATLCGIGWNQMLHTEVTLTAGLKASRVAVTYADWTQCSLCAHYEADRQEVWQLDPDAPCYNRGTPEEVDDGATGGPEE